MHERPHNPDRLTDDEIIRRGIEAAHEQDRIIDDTTARVIASRWHGGQSSALYSLCSTGAVDLEALAPELVDGYNIAENTEDDKAELYALMQYATTIIDREPVEGWHDATKWPNDGSEWQLRLYGQPEGGDD